MYNQQLSNQFDEIISIEPFYSGSNCYDITVENTHNFYANGLLVHNCQNLIFDENFIQATNEKYFECTEKLDGSSCTIYFFNETVGVCSRNFDLKLDQENNAFVNIAKSSKILEWLQEQGKNIALQGELCGPKIQGNLYQLNTFQLFLFDIFDIDQQRYFTPKERQEFISKMPSFPGIFHVPFLQDQQLLIDEQNPKTSLQELLSQAEGNSVLNKKVEREGIVWKSLEGERISFKTISNRFLLKEK